MRNVIDKFLYHNNNAVLLVADFGKFPSMETTDRYINVSLSESLMVNVAIGLASTGKNVFIYSAAGFSLYRAFDTIKHNIVENNFKGNITFLNAGEGFIYDFGLTHMLIDDLNILSDSFYNFNVHMPYDEKSTALALSNAKGVTYIRLCPDNTQQFNNTTSGTKTLYCIGWLLNKVKKIVEKNQFNVKLMPFDNLNMHISENSLLIVDSLYLDKFKVPQLCLDKNKMKHFNGSYEERLAYFGFDDKSIFSFLKEHC